MYWPFKRCDLLWKGEKIEKRGIDASVRHILYSPPNRIVAGKWLPSSGLYFLASFLLCMGDEEVRGKTLDWFLSMSWGWSGMWSFQTKAFLRGGLVFSILSPCYVMRRLSSIPFYTMESVGYLSKTDARPDIRLVVLNQGAFWAP